MIVRFILGVVFLVVLIAGGSLLLGKLSISNSLPDLEGTEEVAFLKHPVQIYRDSFDLSHIYAETDNDAYYALGYVHAQERLFQMDMVRRIGNGTLSEVIGEQGVLIDRWARTIGFNRIASWMWNAASQQTRAYLAAYTNGVNDYIQNHRGRFGFEFDGLSYEPQFWKPTDCMVIGRLMSWEMNFSFWNDAAFADLAEHLDAAHLGSLYPGYPANGPTVLERNTPTPITHDSLAPAIKNEHHSIGAIDPVMELLHSEFGNLLLPPSAGGGSNTVALAKEKTVTKSSMLENDMHLAIGAPARWYATHLHSNQGLNVAGFTVPGLPLILSGRNNDLSWGITNGMIDESDYFQLELDSNGTLYHTPTGTKPVIYRDEIISIKTGNPDAPFRLDTIRVATTDYGVILNGLPTFKLAKMFTGTPATAILDGLATSGKAVSIQWNGFFALNDELGAFFKLHRAASISEASKDLKDFTTPCLNFSIASAKTGEIGFRQIGRIPIRQGNEERLLLPRIATHYEDQWQGFTDLQSISSAESPASGYYVSSNNPALPYRNPPQGENWEPSERAERLNQLVASKKKISQEDIQLFITDVASPLEYNELRPSILRCYPHSVVDTATKIDISTKSALEYLEQWDGVQDSNDISTTILNVYLARLIVNTFWDELGDKLLNEFCYVNNVPVRTISRLLNDSTNVWWDDIRSPQIEHRDEIVKRAFEQSIAWLKRRFGPDVRTWNWGKLHSLTYEHGASKASSLVAALANVSFGRAPGSLSTVSQASYSFWDPFKERVGVSMRMIADMSSSSLWVVLPTGNAGNIFSPNYRDMLPLFRSGNLIELPMKGILPTWKKLELKKRS